MKTIICSFFLFYNIAFDLRFIQATSFLFSFMRSFFVTLCPCFINSYVFLHSYHFYLLCALWRDHVWNCWDLNFMKQLMIPLGCMGRRTTIIFLVYPFNTWILFCTIRLFIVVKLDLIKTSFSYHLHNIISIVLSLNCICKRCHLFEWVPNRNVYNSDADE